ncbi:MAG: membrane protein insertase YidC [Bdellovibrionales bacterium]|nr:membrane protein insertase YidC [Bdellovibrionales bacterium]
MEDKKTALALFLCFIIVVFYSEMFLAPEARKQAEIKIAQQKNESELKSNIEDNAVVSAAQQQKHLSVPTEVGDSSSRDSLNTQAPKANTPTAENYLNADSLIIDTGVAKFNLSLLGARVKSLKLRDHKLTLNSKELYDLVSVTGDEPLPLGVYSGNANDNFTVYTISKTNGDIQKIGNSFNLIANNTGEIELTGKLSDGTELKKIFTFTGESYYFAVEVIVSNPGANKNDIWLEWNEHLTDEAIHDRLDPKNFSILESDNSIEKILVNDKKLNSETFTDFSGNWSALGGKYFMTAIVPAISGKNILVGKLNNNFIARVRGTNSGGKFFVYSGPKITDKLKDAGLQLERSIDLGWFSVLAHPLLWLVKFFYGIFGNYGLAIIVLTLFIKIAFLPLTKVQFESMRAMQALQPEIKALRERIKDPNQLNQEMMALYKKRGVNPMGGCIPMMIQLPVFLGLYNALLNYVALRHAPFALWINDLSAPERLEIFGVGVPVMIIIMGISMIIQQWTSSVSVDPAQKKAMMMVPVVFTVMFIIFPFPSGLVLYWLVNNIISIIQQTILKAERKISPLNATLVASVVIFSVGYILTLI